MRLTDTCLDLMVRQIPRMSIAFMMKNTAQYFSASAVPPHNKWILNEEGVPGSFEIRTAKKDDLSLGSDWRQGSLRETLWLTILHLQYGIPLFKGTLIQTSSIQNTPSLCHYTTETPVVLLELKDRKIQFKSEYPQLISDEVESFWLRSLS